MYLAFGICVGPTNRFETFAKPSIEKACPGAPILKRTRQQSIFEAYNSILAEANKLGVEGLVLLHDDVIIRDQLISEKLQTLFTDPQVGIVGVAGATDVEHIAWWRYNVRGSVQGRDMKLDFYPGTFDVDIVDGMFMALSSVAMRKLRFDEHRFRGFHGYDVDIGMQARAAGLRVVVSYLDIYHDAPTGRINAPASFMCADRMWRVKWRPAHELSQRERLVRMAGPWGKYINSPYIDVAASFLHRVKLSRGDGETRR